MPRRAAEVDVLTVSILTPTTAAREDVLPLLADCIKAQTYSNIVEWVLVDGTCSSQEGVDQSCINAEMAGCNVRWINANKGHRIGGLRQALCDAFVGDIAVCCDDDDYYPPSRVKHAVQKLQKGRVQIAGCTCHIVFDLSMRQQFQYNGFGPNHATHNSMAFTKAYAHSHAYDITVTNAEESSFTNGFTERMCQLDYMHAVIHMIHTNNTINKRESCMRALTGHDKCMRVWRGKATLPANVIEMYTAKLCPDHAGAPDIVYYLGGWNRYRWGPSDSSLDEAEQAVVDLSAQWVRMGFSVEVYGDFDEQVVDHVTYKDWRHFSFARRYNNLILWRSSGAFPIHMVPRLRANRIVYDVHDGYIGDVDGCGIFDCIALKSKFHSLLTNDSKRVVTIPNGIDTFKFPKDDIPRDPTRCVWVSDFTCGLENILKFTWPIVLQHKPAATLHVYHGREAHPAEFEQRIKHLLHQPGVVHHGRRPHKEVCHQKRRSAFHLYFTSSSKEIDCTSIRESAALQCIPVVSQYNLFPERPGVHVRGDPETKEGCANYALAVVHLMNDGNRTSELRSQLSNLYVQDCEETAMLWKRSVLLNHDSPSQIDEKHV